MAEEYMFYDAGENFTNPAEMMFEEQQPTSFDAFGTPAYVGSPEAMYADPTGLAQLQLSAMQGQDQGSDSLWKSFGLDKLTDKQKMMLGGGLGLLGLMQRERRMYGAPQAQTYDGPLSKYGFNPSTYQPYTYKPYAAGGMADGGSAGIASLGGYSDGGQLLRGPGDGVSDSIPAVIGGKQPARLADGEFVIPARIVSEIGNGSTEAGARKLYDMMARIQKTRAKTTGKNAVAKNTNAAKHLPA
jgi:hypothetical protein